MNALIDRIMNEREDHRRCTMLSVAGMTMTRSSSVSSDFSILDEKRRMRVIQDEIETIVDQLPSILLGYVVQVTLERVNQKRLKLALSQDRAGGRFHAFPTARLRHSHQAHLRLRPLAMSGTHRMLHVTVNYKLQWVYLYRSSPLSSQVF